MRFVDLDVDDASVVTVGEVRDAVVRVALEMDFMDEPDARAGLKEFGIMSSHGGPTAPRVLSVDEMEAIVELLKGMRDA